MAEVICDVTGLAFDEAMADLVLRPLEMSASTSASPGLSAFGSPACSKATPWSTAWAAGLFRH